MAQWLGYLTWWRWGVIDIFSDTSIVLYRSPGPCIYAQYILFDNPSDYPSSVYVLCTTLGICISDYMVYLFLLSRIQKSTLQYFEY